VSQKSIPEISPVTWKLIIRFWQFLYEYSWHNLPSNGHLVSHLPKLFLHYLKKTTSEISLFYPMRYDCLINITRKTHLFAFLTLWLTIHPVVHFQLPAVRLLEVVAHNANTGKETLSPFIDSSNKWTFVTYIAHYHFEENSSALMFDNVLLQTNPGCTSRFLTSQTFLNFIW